jgi:hypothetical protein
MLRHPLARVYLAVVVITLAALVCLSAAGWPAPSMHVRVVEDGTGEPIPHAFVIVRTVNLTPDSLGFKRPWTEGWAIHRADQEGRLEIRGCLLSADILHLEGWAPGWILHCESSFAIDRWTIDRARRDDPARAARHRTTASTPFQVRLRRYDGDDHASMDASLLRAHLRSYAGDFGSREEPLPNSPVSLATLRVAIESELTRIGRTPTPPPRGTCRRSRP